MNLTKKQKEWLAWTLSQMVANGFWEENKKDLNRIKAIIRRLEK